MAGRGTAIERSPGRWRLSVNLGLDEKGKQIRQTKTIAAKNKKEAERQLARFVAALEENRIGDHERMSLKQFIEKHWLPAKHSELAPKTYLRYTDFCKRIIAALGNHQLGNLKVSHLNAFYRDMKKPEARLDRRKGSLSQASIHYCHRVLRNLLNDAMRWGFITQNVAKLCRVEQGEKTEPPCYDRDETLQMLSKLKQEPLWIQAIVWLALTTGCRTSELMGLEWQHIDLNNSTIAITQSAQYLPILGCFLKGTKNRSSRRTLQLSPLATPSLLAYHEEQQTNKALLGDKWVPSGRIFVNDDGSPRSPTTMSKVFPAFIKRHNLPPLTFKGLRHTCATLLIYFGLPTPDVSRQLGHSNITTTLNIYTHAFSTFSQHASKLLADNLKSDNRMPVIDTTARASEARSSTLVLSGTHPAE